MFLNNVSQTEHATFSPAKKYLDHEPKIHLNSKKLYQTGSAKYLQICLYNTSLGNTNK